MHACPFGCLHVLFGVAHKESLIGWHPRLLQDSKEHTRRRFSALAIGDGSAGTKFYIAPEWKVPDRADNHINQQSTGALASEISARNSTLVRGDANTIAVLIPANSAQSISHTRQQLPLARAVRTRLARHGCAAKRAVSVEYEKLRFHCTDGNRLLSAIASNSPGSTRRSSPWRSLNLIASLNLRTNVITCGNGIPLRCR